MAGDASALYARNLMNFVNLMLDPKTGELKIDPLGRDHRRTMVCCDGVRSKELTCTASSSIRSLPT